MLQNRACDRKSGRAKFPVSMKQKFPDGILEVRRGGKSLVITWSPVGGLAKYKGQEVEIQIHEISANGQAVTREQQTTNRLRACRGLLRHAVTKLEMQNHAIPSKRKRKRLSRCS